MSQKAHQCPECKTYVLGDHCFICNKDISNFFDIFKNIFGEENE